MDKSKQETGLEVFLVCRSLLHYIMLALHDLPCDLPCAASLAGIQPVRLSGLVHEKAHPVVPNIY